MMMNMPATDSPSTATPPASAATATATSSSLSSAAAAAKAMTQAAGPLRCPRCDSANTKFCYYNNYSLSQPRHFCKACKRYWTRGGTLRNVPVGGGCRKNKRVKKQHQHQPTTTATATVTVNSDPLPSPPLPPPTSSDLSSFFYGLTTSDMNVNLGGTAANAYDALGLGGLIPASASNQLMNSTNLADLQRQPSSCSFLHHNDQYPSSFGSQAPSSLKHVLMSSLKQQPRKAEDQYGQSLLPCDSSGANLGFLNDVKVEGDHGNLNNLMRHDISTECQAGGGYPFEANINGGATDASFLYWNPAMGGAAGWPDAPNSSVAPLI